MLGEACPSRLAIVTTSTPASMSCDASSLTLGGRSVAATFFVTKSNRAASLRRNLDVDVRERQRFRRRERWFSASVDFFRGRLAYNGHVDRANAIRLLKALVAAGANPNTLMAKAWVHDIALKDASLQGIDLASALAYAEGEGWIADGPREGWTIITRAGESAAKLRIV
jgi:hypothetical protein